MVSSLWPPTVIGGAEIYAATLAEALRARDHDVGVVTLGVPGCDVVATVPPWPAPVDRLRSGPAWRRVGFHARDVWRADVAAILAEAVHGFRPDVVHTHVTQGMSVAALAAPTTLGVPHVHTLHDYWLRCWRSTLTTRSGRPCGAVCRPIARLRRGVVRRRPPDVVVGISHAMLDEHDGVRGSRATRVLHHPVARADRRRRRVRPGRAVFGYLGQLTVNKGVPVLLAAAQRTGADLLVAGRGVLEPLVSGHRSAGVRHLGWVDGRTKEEFFERIDCLVVPSVWKEPAGLAVNEAVARGVPVIASRVGGLPEYVPAACHDLLVPPGDVDALAAAMDRFGRDPDGFAPMPADPARGWDAHVDAVLDCYRTAQQA